MSAEKLLEEITIFDNNGFQVKPYYWWVPESIEDEIERLEWNIAKYEQFILNKQKFTQEENKTRMDEYLRLQQLKQKKAA